MRVRFTFAKTEAMRYTGHLDLFRTLERSLRRARLPLAYSEGFRPHPKINIAAPLPLGITSEEELAEVWLKQALPLADIEAQLANAAPPGMEFGAFEEIVGKVPKLQTQTLSAEYCVEVIEKINDLAERVHALLAEKEILMERRKKGRVRQYDLRPLIQKMDVREDSGQQISIRLALQEGATGRVDEVLKALDLKPNQVQIKRTKIHLLP